MRGRTPVSGISDPRTTQAWNLQCGATRLRAVNAVCRVAFLAWADVDRGAEARQSPARDGAYSPVKPCLQKRIGTGKTAVENT